MTQQTLDGGLCFPSDRGGTLSRIGSSNISISANGDKLSIVFDSPVTDTITGGSLRVLTNSATSIDFRLESVITASGATAGQPSGTLANSGTTNNSNVTIAGGATGAQTKTFTGGYAATKGERLALVAVQNGGTTFQVTTEPQNGVTGPLINNGPDCVTWRSVSGTYTQQSAVICAGVEFGGTWHWIPGMWFVDSGGNRSGTIGLGAERGIQFKVPFPTTVGGWFSAIVMNNASADFQVSLYDNTLIGGGDYTALIQKTYRGGDINAFGSVNYGARMQSLFASSTVLSANVTYNLAIKQLTANALTYSEVSPLDTANAAMLAHFGMGASMRGIARASTGGGVGFTASATQFPYNMGIICTGFDDGAGGGSVSVINSRATVHARR